MTVSDQIDTLQKRAADLKSSFEQTQHENNEKVKARLAQAKADIAAGQRAVNEKTEQAASHTQSQWKSMKADAAAKVQDMHDRAERKRDEHDVNLDRSGCSGWGY